MWKKHFYYRLKLRKVKSTRQVKSRDKPMSLNLNLKSSVESKCLQSPEMFSMKGGGGETSFGLPQHTQHTHYGPVESWHTWLGLTGSSELRVWNLLGIIRYKDLKEESKLTGMYLSHHREGRPLTLECLYFQFHATYSQAHCVFCGHHHLILFSDLLTELRDLFIFNLTDRNYGA